MERINVKIHDIGGQEIISQNECFFELHDDRLIHQFDYHAKDYKDEEDKMMGKVDKYEFSRCVFEKNSIVSVDLIYSPKTDMWQVALGVNGAQTDPFFMIDTEAEAKRIAKILEDWRFKK